MAPSKQHKLSPPPVTASSSLSSSTSFIPSITTVTVAQICRSRGYAAAEPSALRSLSSITALYIETLGRSTSAIANSKSRTQSNLLDLIRTIEDLTLTHGGFTGGSDPTRPLLQSSILKELRDFVKSVREVPFAKPILREGLGPLVRVSGANFAEMGVEPPKPHVPIWLPCFPPLERGERRERAEERMRWEEKGAIFETEKEVNNSNNILVRKDDKLGMVQRKKVRFELVGKDRIFISKKRRLNGCLGGKSHGVMSFELGIGGKRNAFLRYARTTSSLGKAEGVLFEDDGDGYGFTQGAYILTYYVAELQSSTITVMYSKQKDHGRVQSMLVMCTFS